MVPQHTGEINYNISTRPPPPPSPPPVLLGCCCSCCHCWCPMLLPAADAAVLICCVCSCFSKSKNWCCAQYVLRCVQQQSTAVKTNVAKHTWNIASKPFTEIGRPYTYTNTAKRCEAQHCRRTKQNQQHAAVTATAAAAATANTYSSLASFTQFKRRRWLLLLLLLLLLLPPRIYPIERCSDATHLKQVKSDVSPLLRRYDL